MPNALVEVLEPKALFEPKAEVPFPAKLPNPPEEGVEGSAFNPDMLVLRAWSCT